MTQNTALEVFRGGWNQLEHAIFTTNQGATATPSNSCAIKPDGTEIYVLEDDGTVRTFPLAIPHDPNTIGAEIRSFSISGTDDTSPIGITFQDDGTQMFIGGQDNKIMLSYPVPVPFDTDSIVASPASRSLGVIPGTLLNSTFSRDGDFFFTTSIGPALVHRFPLPTPWDITSNTTSQTFDPGIGTLLGIAFKPQGDKMYLIDITNTEVVEFDLDPFYNTSSAVANGNVLDFSAVADPFFDIKFRSNGDEVFFLDDSGVVSRYHGDDAWDISTFSLFSNSFSIADTNSVWWKPDGTKFYGLVSTLASDRIDQYLVPNRWNTNDAALPTAFDLAGISDNPRGFWFNRDGTRCFYVDGTTDTVIQLDLATGFDISTMSDPSITSPSLSPATFPEGIAFTKDELTFYIADSGTSSIYQWTVPAPLDIANAVDSTNVLSIPGSNITDIRLSTDNKFMYVSDRANELIIRFSLPVDGNVANAVRLDDFDISAKETNVRGLYIRETDGKKLYIVGQSEDAIVSFDMTLEFNNAITTDLGVDLSTDAGETIVV